MRPSSDSGQVEPLAALAAVFAVGAGLAVYGGVLEQVTPGEPTRTVAEEVTDGLVRVDPIPAIRPASIDGLEAVTPPGWQANLTIRTGSLTRRIGPSPPPDAAEAIRLVSVVVAPTRVRPGRLRVRVWR